MRTEEREHLIARYEAGPAVLSAALERVPAKAMTFRPTANAWSAHDCAVPQCASAWSRIDVRPGGDGRG
jgi:hypothetical protein